MIQFWTVIRIGYPGYKHNPIVKVMPGKYSMKSLHKRLNKIVREEIKPYVKDFEPSKVFMGYRVLKSSTKPKQ